MGDFTLDERYRREQHFGHSFDADDRGCGRP